MVKGNKVYFSFLILLFVFSISITGNAATQDNEWPKTGLEIRNDGSWTTHQEELDFLKELSEKSERVDYEIYGTTAEGRPMHLVKVGFPVPGTNEEIADGRSILIKGTFHGNEPSGREMSLQTIRNLAFTDDPNMIELMEKSTILFLPTLNPDGREANRRRNDDNYDINRDAVRLITPEGQTLARITNEFQPEIILDAHERMSGPNMSLLGNQNRMIDPDLRALNDELIDDYMFVDLGNEGFEYTYYPSSATAYPTNSRGVSGFRHSIGILTEASWLDEPLDRVAAQMVSVNAILRFYHERFDEVGEVVANSRINHQNRGAAAKEPFYLEGRPEDEITNEKSVLDPPPCGYLINEEQKKKIERQIDLFSLTFEKIDDGYYITMNQPMMAIIPYIMDENARTKLINADRVYDCSDIDNLVAPSAPTPDNFTTDFSEHVTDATPQNWTELWGESQWVIKDNPARLEHVVTDGEDRRLLVWDEVGEVHGDVEIATLVRTDQEGELFQLHLNAYGTADSADSYYLDVKSQHGTSEIQINRVIGSLYKSLEKETLNFNVSVDTWYQIVFQREGHTLRGKIWEYGEEEPDDWQIEVDDEYMEFGNVGIGHETNGVINDWKYFSVGTYGNEAARAPKNLLDDTDKSVLQRRISQIENENLKEENYLKDSWETFQLALDKAKRVLADQNATQEQVDEAVQQLYDAYTGLSAQYVTDFTEYDVGSAPDDWSMLWRESEWKINDDPVRLTHSLSDDGSGRRGLTWDKPGNIVGDVEIYSLVRKSNTTSGVMFQLHLQATGTSGNENSYYLDVRNNGNIRINRNRTGGFSSLGSAAVSSATELDTWYEVVFSRKGNKLRGKVWRYGEEEPKDWQIEIEDDNFFSGRVGLGHVTNSVVNDFAFFSVGTANAQAPRAPSNLLVDKSPLEDKINELNQLVPDDYTADSWGVLANQLLAAENILKRNDLSQEDILDMIIELEKAYENLQTAGVQYQTNFSGYEVGKVPNDWSTLWRESGWAIKDDPIRLEHFVTEGGKRRVLTWDKVGEVKGDVEVSALVKSSDVGGSTMFQLHLHGSGEAGSETSYYLDLRTTNAVRINRNRGGGFSSLNSTRLPFEAQENVWYQAVLRYDGGILKGKVWPYGEDEPKEWQVEVQDDNFANGKVGLGHVSSGVTNDWAFFGVGTNDKEAPRAPEGLFDKTDKTELQTRVDDINGKSLDESDYTSDSWKILQGALDQARLVLEDSKASQELVDSTLENLNEAYENLRLADEPPIDDEVDKSKLQAQVDEINKDPVDEADYSQDSWETFQMALSIAMLILDDDDVGQESVNSAFLNLAITYENLVEIDEPPVGDKGDKSELQSLLNKINKESLVESDYTSGSWGTFQVAYNVAMSVFENDDASQGSVDSALANLNVIYGNLVVADEPPVDDETDKSELQSRLDEIDKESLDKSDYTADSWEIFMTALDQATSVLEDDDASQELIDSTLANLNKAHKNLESASEPPVNDEVDKLKLQSRIDEINKKSLEESEYTKTSWSTFMVALNTAMLVLEDDNTTQESVDNALSNLNGAYANLVPVAEPPIDDGRDKSELQSRINEISDDPLNESDYTPTSWGAFRIALNTAMSVLGDDNASQESIDDALADLDAAYASLIPIEDSPLDDEVYKSELQSWIDKINDKVLDKSYYTSDSWEALLTAMNIALSVLEDVDASQELVDSTLTDLIDAYENLEPVDTTDKIDEFQDTDDNKLPKTGTSIFNQLLMGTILLIIGGVLFIIIRDRKINTK